MSSAILYVAIVAIWAGVLIPRWLRRDTSERTSDDATMAEQEPTVEDASASEQEPVIEERPRAPRARPGGRDARPSGSEERPARRGPDEDGGLAGEHEHARVLSARRRLLMLLLGLTVASCVLAVTQLAAWWVIVPPFVMLGGYLALLREAAQADAERRELIRARSAEVAKVTAAEAAARPAPVPALAPDAEIIDISASMPPGGAEFYDQYADAKLRAVGD